MKYRSVLDCILGGMSSFARRITQGILVVMCSSIVCLYLMASGTNDAYPENPPIAHTGGFGELTCQRCHFDQPLHAPDNVLTLNGMPDAYETGTPYRLTVQLANEAMQRSGFQMAIRFADGARAGQQAGSLKPVDDRVDVVVDNSSGVQYAQHTIVGTSLLLPDTARWMLTWIPPPSPASEVVVHLIANAANGDDSEFGDAIYLGSWVSRGKAQQ